MTGIRRNVVAGIFREIINTLNGTDKNSVIKYEIL